ncbi:MAG: hypothetical protein K1000chlam4_01064, partial [Chlamydiae bacterium]|nr:hypothetical protein [Chlamydiota bacterium]
QVDGPRSSLYEAARYSLLAPAKRIRPRIVIATAKMYGIPEEVSLAPACALEMIHTYSLIHDDLPCMDDDDFRRGKPSLHKAFSESHAVLAGDFLLTYAFETIARSPGLLPEQKVALTATLAKSAGGEGMVGGQVMDLHSNLDSLEEIHLRKTATLFRSAAQCGGILGNVSSETYDTLTNFGSNFGLLFQILDDIHDRDCHLTKKEAEARADLFYQSTKESLLALEEDHGDLEAILDELFVLR